MARCSRISVGYMKANELRLKSEKELKALLGEDREKLRQMRFDLASGKVKNVREIRSKRRDIARILTILTQNKKHKSQN